MVQKFEHRDLTVYEHGAPDADNILQIGETIKQLKEQGYQIMINHIKGHQKIPEDENHPLRNVIALNIEADWLAGSAHLKNIIHHDNTTQYPAAGIFIECKQEQLYDGIYKKTRDAYNDEPMITYLQDRFKWRPVTYNTKWWSIHSMALLKFKLINRLIIQKFIMDHLACNYREAVCGDEEIDGVRYDIIRKRCATI